MRRILSLLLLLVFAACRADDDGKRSVSEEFAKLQAEARAAGGIAVLLAPSKEFRVEVIDVASPIYGTGVSIPVKAVPGDASNPVLVIKHLPGYPTDGTKDAVVSHVVDIRMLELFGREPIEPALPVTLFLPFTDSTTLDHFNLHVGLFNESAEKWGILNNEIIETSRTRLRARTTAFGPFVALEGKQQIVRKTTFYRITQAGKLVCQGELPDDGTSMGTGSFRVTGAKDGVLKFAVKNGFDTNYYGQFEFDTTTHLEEPSGTQDVTEDLGEASTISISCGSATVTSTNLDNQVRQLELKDWFTAFKLGTGNCLKYAGKTCYAEEGETAVKALFDFTDDKDPLRRGQLTIDRAFPSVTWEQLR